MEDFCDFSVMNFSYAAATPDYTLHAFWPRCPPLTCAPTPPLCRRLTHHENTPTSPTPHPLFALHCGFPAAAGGIC